MPLEEEPDGEGKPPEAGCPGIWGERQSNTFQHKQQRAHRYETMTCAHTLRCSGCRCWLSMVGS